MKKQLFLTLLLSVISIIFGIEDNYAQITETLHVPDSAYVQILKSKDGSTLYGRITVIYDEEIEFTTELGTFKIRITNIKSIEDVPQSSFRAGEYWFPNPNNTRLYFAPKGHMLRKGTGYFQNIFIFFAGFAVGLTDNITLGGGMSLFPGLDIDEQLFYLTPKVGIKATETFDLAVGALLVNVPDDNGTAGILYGVGTFGNENIDFTIGFGYGFVDSDLAEKPMIMLGFERRTSRRTAFVSENWIFPGVDNPLISYGFRFFGEKIAVDLAFVNILGEDAIFPGIPYVDFIYNF
ncbi:hypothetical protein IIA29_07865 [candidate division KSB1 bacterium]|nr:hypothetical protein [candidate division KSB1 bacterium]